MKTKTANRRKPCRIYVPKSFDPKEHLPPELQNHADSARYLLHRIIRGRIDKRQDQDGFVPLKFEYLRTVIPDRVIKPLREALEPEQLANNDVFIDVVMAASQAAIRTSQEKKREALTNAVLNAALPNPPDESRQQIFIGLVDSLTVWHLKILRFFSDPAKAFEEQAKTPPQYSIGGSLSQLLTAAYPELANERELYDLIGKDLYGKGLMGIDGFHGTMTGRGAYEKRTTVLGEQFLAFISEPKKS